jgi:hypothetical protein
MACTHLWQGAGAMLAAYRLAGLSALEGHYAGVSVSAQFAARVATRLVSVGVGERRPAGEVSVTERRGRIVRP